MFQQLTLSHLEEQTQALGPMENLDTQKLLRKLATPAHGLGSRK